jgi:ribonucleoside-diphosphate reductase alpha chain
VAVAISAAESQQRGLWQERFQSVMEDSSFLPSRQILYACSPGAPATACMASCCAMRPMADSLQGAFDALQYSVLCLQAGCDVAVDFSGAYPARWSGFAQDHVLPGPSAFAQLWRVARDVLGDGQSHSGDVTLTLRCDHPDIELFLEALSSHALAPHLHCAVLVPDAFMQAVQRGEEWPLLFPLRGAAVPPGGCVYERVWAGGAEAEPCLVERVIAARSLWVRLLQAQYMYAAPRLLFVDHMQRNNNWWYGERPFTSSPSGHVPLGAAGCGWAVHGRHHPAHAPAAPPGGRAPAARLGAAQGLRGYGGALSGRCLRCLGLAAQALGPANAGQPPPGPGDKRPDGPVQPIGFAPGQPAGAGVGRQDHARHP